jgi:hypothetical protein
MLNTLTVHWCYYTNAQYTLTVHWCYYTNAQYTNATTNTQHTALYCVPTTNMLQCQTRWQCTTFWHTLCYSLRFLLASPPHDKVRTTSNGFVGSKCLINRVYFLNSYDLKFYPNSLSLSLSLCSHSPPLTLSPSLRSNHISYPIY